MDGGAGSVAKISDPWQEAAKPRSEMWRNGFELPAAEILPSRKPPPATQVNASNDMI